MSCVSRDNAHRTEGALGTFAVAKYGKALADLTQEQRQDVESRRDELQEKVASEIGDALLSVMNTHFTLTDWTLPL